MKIKKYGIWRVRYAYNSRKIYKGWLLKNGQSLLFSSEHNALKYRHRLEKMLSDNSIDMEVRCCP